MTNPVLFAKIKPPMYECMEQCEGGLNHTLISEVTSTFAAENPISIVEKISPVPFPQEFQRLQESAAQRTNAGSKMHVVSTGVVAASSGVGTVGAGNTTTTAEPSQRAPAGAEREERDPDHLQGALSSGIFSSRSYIHLAGRKLRTPATCTTNDGCPSEHGEREFCLRLRF